MEHRKAGERCANVHFALAKQFNGRQFFAQCVKAGAAPESCDSRRGLGWRRQRLTTGSPGQLPTSQCESRRCLGSYCSINGTLAQFSTCTLYSYQAFHRQLQANTRSGCQPQGDANAGARVLMCSAWQLLMGTR